MTQGIRYFAIPSPRPLPRGAGEHWAVVSRTVLTCLALVVCLTSGGANAGEGVIRGRVVNLSEDGAPAPRIEVLLRARLDDEFVVVAATESDDQGGFVFSGLPEDEELVYLPGANWGGIHYPGPRLQLDRQRPTATVKLAIRETVAAPNPLVVRQHEIVIQAEAGALHVTEALLVDNPTQRTFVGHSVDDEQLPVTFSLGIPLDFQRLTFEKEFFGRGFSIVDDRLVTSLPWEPGPRWLRFTATVPNDQALRRWERRLDGPCENLRVRVVHDKPGQVRCNLPSVAGDPAGERVFAAAEALAADQVLWIELGSLPLPWTRYARWGALLVLASSIAAVSLTLKKRQPSPPADTPRTPAGPHTTSRRRSRRRSTTR